MTRRTIILPVILLPLVLIWMQTPLDAQQQRATLKDGRDLSGVLEGQTAGELQFRAEGKSHSLSGIRRISFPRRTPVKNFFQPARVFHLQGGGKVTGNLSGFDDEKITIEARGKTCELPRRAVLAIEPLPGERQLVYEDFSSPDRPSIGKVSGRVKIERIADQAALEVLPGGSFRYQIPSPISAGRFRAAFVAPQDHRPAPTCNLELQFQKDEITSKVTIHLASPEGFYTVSHSPNLRLTVQKLKRQSGWQPVTVLFDDARFQVLIGSHLLAFGRPPNAELQSFRLFADPLDSGASSPSDPPALGFDHLQITQSVDRENHGDRLTFDEQDQAVLENGDVLYGNVTDLDSSRIKLKGVFGEVALPWRQLRRIIFKPRENRGRASADQPSHTGWQSEVSFQRFADSPRHEGDRLAATILAIEGDSLRMAHPWLGEFRVPFEQVDFLEPGFFGESLWLSPEVRHLGNQDRLSFRHSEPQGSTWTGAFALDAMPEGDAFLHLDVADLEPAGPDTPPASRFLAELRDGFLGTEVFVNGESLGRLNDRINLRSSIAGSQTLRLPIPENVLRAGENTWRIEQTPSRNRPEEFDDCQVGPVRLEIEKSPVVSGPMIRDD